jgi:predicted nucleic acid-binding protein
VAQIRSFNLLQVTIERDHGPRSFWRVYNADPAVIVPHLDALDELTEEWITHPRLRIVAADPSLSLDALANMRRYHLLPRDAFHLAMMRQYSITDLVTLDADFLAVPDLTLFTCVPAMLAQAAKP